MITELAITYYNIEQDAGSQLLTYSEACGRALQKTNIVKDFAKDLARGDSFLPDEWLQEVDYAPFAFRTGAASGKGVTALRAWMNSAKASSAARTVTPHPAPPPPARSCAER